AGVAAVRLDAGVQGTRWRFQTRGPVRSSPVIHDGSVYVGSGDGHLYAIALDTGDERWRFDAGASVASAPLVTQTRVCATTLVDTVFCVDRASGALQWRATTGTVAALAWGYEGTDIYSSSPVLVDDLVIAGGGDGTIYAWHIGNGDVAWRHRTGGRVRSSPAVAESTVYVGSFDGMVYAIDARTGAERWRVETEGTTLTSATFGYDRRSIQSSPVVADSILLVGARDGHLYALNRHTGRRRWTVAHDETSWIIATPAVRDSIVIDASSDAHFVHALGVADGSERWRVKTYHSVWASPLISGDQVIVAEGAYGGFGRGVVRGFDIATGAERWRLIVARPVMSSPAAATGVLVFGSDDGAVYAVGMATPSLARAVFWDSTVAQRGLGRTGARIRDRFLSHGYELLNARRLAEWMAARIDDAVPSVVVFAIDHAPETVAPVSADSVLFRRYLDAGGKVVWTGLPPHMWLPDSAGAYALSSFGTGGTRKLLGVSVHVDPWDRFGATATRAGEQWGLSGWWLTAWSSPAIDGVEVLGRDERSHLAAWVRSYGGRPGSGFVQVGRPEWDDTALEQLVRVAEHFPRAASVR
ncbi:MAG: PQQ-binding-like beta-propeller repeat protein, partial [Cytophagaceae bacterium]|nr:PQQ-binding-like beta-propeller repeat protein [Gemmatimonadaceae bacterium]